MRKGEVFFCFGAQESKGALLYQQAELEGIIWNLFIIAVLY